MPAAPRPESPPWRVKPSCNRKDIHEFAYSELVLIGPNPMVIVSGNDLRSDARFYVANTSFQVWASKHSYASPKRLSWLCSSSGPDMICKSIWSPSQLLDMSSKNDQILKIGEYHPRDELAADEDVVTWST